MMRSRAETLKIRYQVYRRLGYSANVSRALSKRALDVSNLSISSKTGKLKRNHVTKSYVEDLKANFGTQGSVVDRYKDYMAGQRHDGIYPTRWGMYTHDKRYKGYTGKVASYLKNQHHLTTDQSYFFLYLQTRYGMSYAEAKKQLFSNREFEEYKKGKD